MIPNQFWDDGWGYHKGLEERYFTVFSVRKVRFYQAPPFSTLSLTNQGILTFKNRSVITMARWKPHLELGNFSLVWMSITPSLMIINSVLQRVTLMRGDTKDYQITLRQMTSQITVMKKSQPTLMTNILGMNLTTEDGPVLRHMYYLVRTEFIGLYVTVLTFAQ